MSVDAELRHNVDVVSLNSRVAQDFDLTNAHLSWRPCHEAGIAGELQVVSTAKGVLINGRDLSTANRVALGFDEG